MRGKGQTVRAISDAAPWSDWEVASLCLVAGLVEAVTKKGGAHPLLGDWHRVRAEFCDAAVAAGLAGGSVARQRTALRTVTEKIRQVFDEVTTGPE
jgi:hypothetical protein